MKIGEYEIQIPFVTTSSDSVKTILELANILPGQRIVDLGSGDGRMILEFGKNGALAHGYEFNETLVEKTKRKIADQHLESNVQVFLQDFWSINLNKYDVIYIYGMRSILGKLEQKLEREMRPEARFISNIFPLPHWKPKKIKKNVYLYIK